MSVLTVLDDIKKPVTPEFLLSQCFEKIPWGSPDSFIPNEHTGIGPRKEADFARKNRSRWSKRSMCWEKNIVYAHRDISVRYFPETFEKPVIVHPTSNDQWQLILQLTPKNMIIISTDRKDDDDVLLQDVYSPVDFDRVGLAIMEHFK